MGWREEIVSALDFWLDKEGVPERRPRWQWIGRAVKGAEPGEYVVDVRGTDRNLDQLQPESLRLAGPDERSVESGHQVMDSFKDDNALRVRVAEFADPPDPCLWLLPQPTAFLIEALRDGIAALGEAPLAHLLARGEAGGQLSAVGRPEGTMTEEQDRAYRACTGQGLWLVWGPPGTGKTYVLKTAISDLIAAGKRVLLVSATNIAVDNALRGVVRERRHGDGEIVRVGPPQLREVAEDPQVCLTLMVRARLEEAEQRRRTVAAELVEFRRRAEELTVLDGQLSDFDAEAYERDRALVSDPDCAPDALTDAVNACVTRTDELSREREAADQALSAAREAVRDTEDARRLWEQADEFVSERQRLGAEAEAEEAKARTADGERAAAEVELGRLEAVKLPRLGKRRARAQEQLDRARRMAEATGDHSRYLAEQAARKRSETERDQQRLDEQAAQLRAAIPFGQEEIRRREAQVEKAVGRRRRCRVASEENCSLLESLRGQLARAEAAQRRVVEVDGKRYPVLHARAEQLRPKVTADAERRAALENRHKELQEEYDRLARDAQGEIIRGAQLVVTTLSRFRTNKTVFEGEYDVVLVDEAGTAMLPEALLAVAKAKTTAVLLGDFMQLGPVLPKLIEDSKRSDVRRWLVREVYENCGIDSPQAALDHLGCVVLDVQHRFGTDVMRLANSLAYDGTLKGGSTAQRRAQLADPDDPEIVLIDTDGLGDLGRTHLIGRRSGWWPAGPLLARALIDLHAGRGETAGVVTPYKAQAEVTLEALRDVEAEGGALTEVGTAHRFQGREFPVVIFDTVEGELGDGLWMAHSSRESGGTAWARNGIRLFNVAVTRVQTILYVVGSRSAIMRSPEESALGRLAALDRERRVRKVPARALIEAAVVDRGEGELALGRFGAELADVLSQHVKVTSVDDERTFYETFAEHIAAARHTLWIWSPWVAKRVLTLLPELEAAVRRGVRVTVFVRDPSDSTQGRPDLWKLVEQLRAVVHTVVPVNVMHQKIVVIDEQTTLFGSLNSLSQSRTREVVLTVQGSYFARKILTHENAETFSHPPRCGECNGDQVDLRRRSKEGWVWRCYNPGCPTGGGRKAWWTRVRFRSGGEARGRRGTS